MPLELDSLRIDKYTEIVSRIYNSGEILEEFSRGNLIMMPKNVGGKECEIYRVISLIKGSEIQQY